MACLGWDDLLSLDERAARGCHRRRRRRVTAMTAVAALAQRLPPRWTATSPTHTSIMSVNTVCRR